jgi:hypothetical protein
MEAVGQDTKGSNIPEDYSFLERWFLTLGK